MTGDGDIVNYLVMASKLKQIAEGYVNLAKKGLGVAQKDLEQLAVDRYTICNSCPNLSKGDHVNLNTCDVCGCLLGAKIRSIDASCPKDKW